MTDDGCASASSNAAAVGKAQRADPAAFVARPPSVIRGANSQTVHLSVDWLRFVLPGAMWRKAVGILDSYFATEETELKTGRGLFNLPEAARFGEASVHFDSASDGLDTDAKTYCVVELPASALALFDDVHAWLRLSRALLEVGGRCSRVDLACDWMEGRADGLIQRIVSSCRREEHCGGRRWKPVEEFGLFNHYVAEGVNLGLRGKNGSGRYMRFYDKGLQTESCERGQWVRGELECTQEVARDVLMTLVDADDWASAVAEIALGAFDFRENPDEKNVARRKRCQWWQDMMPTPDQRRIRARRPKANVAGYAKWMCKAVLPAMAGYAAVLGLAWGDLAHVLGWGGETIEDPCGRQIGRELAKFLEQAQPGQRVGEWYLADCLNDQHPPYLGVYGDVRADREFAHRLEFVV